MTAELQSVGHKQLATVSSQNDQTNPWTALRSHSSSPPKLLYGRWRRSVNFARSHGWEKWQENGELSSHS